MIFQSTQPEWAATPFGIKIFGSSLVIFQSTQPEWAATEGFVKTIVNYDQFQSTQPEWAATDGSEKTVTALDLFQSTQPEWAATVPCVMADGLTDISIHAARVGCDRLHLMKKFRFKDFNPRSPSGLRLDSGFCIKSK